MRPFLLILISIILYSCHQGTRSTIQYFDINDFKVEKKLTGEVIDLYTDQPLQYSMINDTMVIVSREYINKNSFEIFNLNNKRKEFELTYPNENTAALLFNLFYKKNHRPYIYSHTYLMLGDIKMRKINTDSLLRYKDAYIPENFSLPTFAKDYDFINADSLVVSNNYYSDIEKFKNPSLQSIYKIKLGDGQPFPDSLIKFNTRSISADLIAVSEKHDRILSLDAYLNKIRIYDKRLLLKKTLIGPGEDHLKPGIKNDSTIHYHNSYNSNTGVFSTADHVYVLYYGKEVSPSNPKDIPPNAADVFKITWDGDLIAHYTLNDPVSNIYIDSKEENIYGTHYIDEQIKPTFLRFSIR